MIPIHSIVSYVVGPQPSLVERAAVDCLQSNAVFLFAYRRQKRNYVQPLKSDLQVVR